ncbi:MAG: hypothetical protein ACI955_001686 [Zhongshania sp.]|jgi:hypothetical protein
MDYIIENMYPILGSILLAFFLHGLVVEHISKQEK